MRISLTTANYRDPAARHQPAPDRSGLVVVRGPII